MDPIAVTELAFEAVLALTALLAGLMAWHLHRHRQALGARYLAGALGITGLVLAFLAVDQLLAPAEPTIGGWWDLTQLLVGAVAATVPVLLVGWALAHPRALSPVRGRPRAALVGLAIPAFLLLFLAIAWPGAAPVDPHGIAGDDQARFAWDLWFDRYDTVEDGTMSIVMGTLLLGGLIIGTVLAYRWLLGASPAERQLGRRHLAVLGLPAIGASLLLAIAILFQAALPPSSPWLDAFVSEGLVDTVLPLSLLVVPQLLWAWTMLPQSMTGSRRRAGDEPSPAS